MMGFKAHFSELKSRFVIIFLTFILFFGISYYFSDEIYRFLLQPLNSYFDNNGLKRDMIYTGLSEAFFTYVKLSVYVATYFTFPFLVWQIYMFISPGLTKKEKSFLLPVFIISPMLFSMGLALAYYFVLPAVFDFFLSFEQARSDNFLPIILEARVSEYLSLCLTIMLAFGCAFQMPTILVILTKLRIIGSKLLVKYRRFAIVIIFIIAAIITPPDIISQIILAVIMIILYELSLLTCKYIERK